MLWIQENFPINPMELSDLQIVNECKNGNLKKFGELYEKYADKIYSFIYYKTLHKQTAEDITSQTFVNALEKIYTYNESKGSFKSWLYQIARNLVMDYYRSKKLDTDIDGMWNLSANNDVMREADTSIEIEKVAKYLNVLKRNEREIIIMRLWDELSYKEIADILGKSIASCKMAFARVISKIRADIVTAFIMIFIQLFNQ